MGERSVSTAKRILQSRFGITIIAAVSFIEAALPVPVLTDPFLVAAILINRSKTTRIILVTIISSVIGGIFAYAMAALFLDTILQFVSSGVIDQLDQIITNNQSNTLLLTLVGAITPVPYTIVAWVAAIIEGSLMVFIIGSILGRGLRYSIVGYSTYKFGPMAISYAKKYLGFVSLIILIIVILYAWSHM